MNAPQDSFPEGRARLRAHDNTAARAVFQRCTGRLLARPAGDDGRHLTTRGPFDPRPPGGAATQRRGPGLPRASASTRT